MLCTKSDEEFEKEIEQVEQILDILSPDSTLGKLLRQKQISLDTDVGAWNAVCEECLKMVEDGSGSTVMYNRLYDQLETALDRQNLFSSLGGDALIYGQEALSNATNVLDVAAKIGTVVTYYQEFQDADSFTVSALRDYLYTHTKTDEMSHAMKIAMMGHAAALQTDGTLYSATRFIEDNLMEILVDETGLDTMLGLPANIVLVAWDIASGTLPFYEGGLGAVEKREISNYAQKLQNDAMENVKGMLSGMQSGAIPLDSQSCMKLAEYCYVFLKACYIARSSAIESLDLENKDDEFLDAVAGKLCVADDTNDQIAYYLSILSQANGQNEGMILGFLPKNNTEYLNDDSDGALLDAVASDVIDMESTFGFEKVWEMHEQLGGEHVVTSLAFQENGTFVCGVGWYQSEWYVLFDGTYKLNGDEIILSYTLYNWDNVVSYQVCWEDKKLIQTSEESITVGHPKGSEHLFVECPDGNAEWLMNQLEFFRRYGGT